MSERIEIRPQPGPQTTFLSSSADIAIYGGAAGGGKTWALLMEPLRHIGNPRFGAVVFRRESPQITNEGGLWDASEQVYPHIGATAVKGDLEWRFPAGSTLSFCHLQHESDKFKWQGTEVPLLCFDELPHFTESQFFYMLSRNRSTCGIRPYVRGTCNPDPGWVKRFLAPWVDPLFDGPKAKSGELRYFTRIDGRIVWVDKNWRDEDGLPPKSLTFIKSSIYDNKILLAKDPGYLSNLKALPEVEQRRLLHGDWNIRQEGLVYPSFLDLVADFELQLGDRYGGIDWGWHNPFAGLAGTLDHDDTLWIDWEQYGSQRTLSEHAQGMPRDLVRWWADPAGADQIAEMRRSGFPMVPCVHIGRQPLEDGIAKVTDRMRTGRLKVHPRCVHLIDESGLYHYDPKTEKPVDKDNHALAALRYLIVGLDRGKPLRGTPQTPDDPEAGAAVIDLPSNGTEGLYHDDDGESRSHHDPHWWS